MEKGAVEKIDSSVSTEPNGNFDRSWRDQTWVRGQSISQEAQQNHAEEENTSVRHAIKYFKPAICWSLVFSTCVIMEGYDTNLLGNFFAYPSFQRKFGRYVGVTEQTPSGYQLEAKWQAAVGQAAGIGSFFGTLLNG